MRSLLALFAVLGLSYLALEFSNRLYYNPICKRYAESRQLTFDKYPMGWAKHGWPAEYFFRDKAGNSKRVEVAEISLTSRSVP